MMTAPSAQTRRRAGRTMLLVAAVGVVVAVVGSVVAWSVVGRLDETGSESLDVSLEALSSVQDTIDLAGRIIDTSAETLTAVEDTLAAIATSFRTSNEVLGDVTTLTDDAGPALTNATATLDQLASVGSTIDSVLGALSRIPLGPDYDPDDGFGETVRQLAADLDPLAESLDEIGTGLRDAGPQLEELETELSRLSTRVGEVRRELGSSDELLAQYRANVESARSVASATRDDLDSDLGWIRLLIVIGGANFAVGQIVPYWEGRRQLRLATEADATEA